MKEYQKDDECPKERGKFTHTKSKPSLSASNIERWCQELMSKKLDARWRWSSKIENCACSTTLKSKMRNKMTPFSYEPNIYTKFAWHNQPVPSATVRSVIKTMELHKRNQSHFYHKKCLLDSKSEKPVTSSATYVQGFFYQGFFF
jgi:hypothetical protein